jgi:hypothetical protein
VRISHGASIAKCKQFVYTRLLATLIAVLRGIVHDPFHAYAKPGRPGNNAITNFARRDLSSQFGRKLVENMRVVINIFLCVLD